MSPTLDLDEPDPDWMVGKMEYEEDLVESSQGRAEPLSSRVEPDGSRAEPGGSRAPSPGWAQPRNGSRGQPGRGGRLEARGLVHRFGKGKNRITALQDIDFTVPAGEFVALVGPSGCGKSTLLRLIAGFETPTEGTVLVDGERPVPGVQAGQVFQAPRLFPWHSVGGNV